MGDSGREEAGKEVVRVQGPTTVWEAAVLSSENR